MNRATKNANKNATVKRYHYDDRGQHERRLADSRRAVQKNRLLKSGVSWVARVLRRIVRTSHAHLRWPRRIQDFFPAKPFDIG
jgi:hypothetical protein